MRLNSVTKTLIATGILTMPVLSYGQIQPGINPIEQRQREQQEQQRQQQLQEQEERSRTNTPAIVQPPVESKPIVSTATACFKTLIKVRIAIFVD